MGLCGGLDLECPAPSTRTSAARAPPTCLPQPPGPCPAAQARPSSTISSGAPSSCLCAPSPAATRCPGPAGTRLTPPPPGGQRDPWPHGQQAWPQGSPGSGPGPVWHTLSLHDQPGRPAPVSPGARPWSAHPPCLLLVPASRPPPSSLVHPLLLWPDPAPQQCPLGHTGVTSCLAKASPHSSPDSWP